MVAWLLIWHVRATEHLSIEAVLCAAGFALLCLAYGRIFERVTAALVPNRVGIAYPLLTGFFAFNTLLFILTVVSPFGMPVNVAMLAALALFATGLAARRPRAAGSAVDELPGLICIAVTGAAATLWVSDLQPMMEIRGPLAIFRAWQDVFIHVREISAFGQAHGWTSMSDIKMAGAAAPAYHFASYVSTAAMATLTSTTAVAAYGGFLLPLGILLTGLAAFVLIGSFWGIWPAMAAAIAVVTLPDAYQQGFGSALLGFHFMSQVNPGMLYGIACMAIAWVFMIEGCRRSSYGAIAVAYGFLAVCLTYKAHLFVANAFLLLIFPCIFFVGLRMRWRVSIGALFIAIFVVTIQISQQSPRVPTIRMDGSGIGEYLHILMTLHEPGAIKEALRSFFFLSRHSRLVDGVAAAALILFFSFGAWLVIAPVVQWKLRKRIPRDLLVFPIVVVVNYLVMALGLALEKKGIGTPEEMMNRPMAWAYFVLVAFSTAGMVMLWRSRSARDARTARASAWVAAALVCAALVGVGLHATNLQTLHADREHQNYADFNGAPLCQVRAAEYIRDHSRVDDLMQDSRGDPRLLSTAIAERQSYVSVATFGGRAAGWDDRRGAIDAVQRSGNVDALEALAARDGITWYLLHPEDAEPWPRSFVGGAAFECSGYRVIRLLPKADAAG